MVSSSRKAVSHRNETRMSGRPSVPILEMRGVTKRFPGVLANNRIDFAVDTGEIHALLGENGAGKSTLMNILYGLLRPDAGEILLRGEPVNIDSPRQAIALGIGMVHQHFMLVPAHTVTENIVMGMKSAGRFVLETARAEKEIQELADRFGFHVDPKAFVWRLSVGEQQRVEILKALYRGADLLILDEPSSVLTPQEVADLFGMLRRLTDEGKSVVFITHKLNEVITVSDRVTVLRGGAGIETVRTSDTDERELARMMVGRDVILRVEKKAATPGDVVLEVEDLCVHNDRGLPAVNGIDFRIRSGEIFGIVGVDGNGQAELVEALAGLRAIRGGRARLAGEDLRSLSTGERFKRGISHIPEARQRRGLVLGHTLAENAILQAHDGPPFSTRGRLNHEEIARFTRRILKDFDVRAPGIGVRAGALSGGNQQKLVLGRELAREPRLLIAAQPTRGLDVGAVEYVFRRLLEERDRGVAVLLVSTELSEVLTLGDRIAVMFEGKLMDQMDAGDVDMERIGLLMGGVG